MSMAETFMDLDRVLLLLKYLCEGINKWIHGCTEDTSYQCRWVQFVEHRRPGISTHKRFSTIIVLTGTLRGQYTVAFMSHISLVANTGIELTLFCAPAGCSLTRGLALGATTLLEVLVGAALTDSSAACQHGRANSIAYLGEASHHSCSEDNYDRNWHRTAVLEPSNKYFNVLRYTIIRALNKAIVWWLFIVKLGAAISECLFNCSTTIV